MGSEMCIRDSFIHGARVEVVDLLIAVGTDRVGHGACVLGELGQTQRLDVADALDRAGGLVAEHVGGELLIAEDRQALLERELEPVAERDTVARPIVEVLVADDGLDVGVVLVLSLIHI